MLEVPPRTSPPSPWPPRSSPAALRERLGADGINILNSCGRAAWQTVFHFHVHVIPRYEGDPLRLPWTPGARRRATRSPPRPATSRADAMRPAALATAALALAAVAAAAPMAADAQVEAIEPTFQLDAKKDVRGPLDVVRVAMSTRTDGSLRGELTMRKAWDTADVGPRGSLCLKLYVKADPGSDIPEYLVCATPPKQGDALVGRVLRNKANGMPRNVGEAAIARPSARTIYFAFDAAAIGRPAKLKFAGESVWRGSKKCPQTTGCADLAPNAPDARDFRLRRDGRSG